MRLETEMDPSFPAAKISAEDDEFMVDKLKNWDVPILGCCLTASHCKISLCRCVFFNNANFAANHRAMAVSASTNWSALAKAKRNSQNDPASSFQAQLRPLRISHAIRSQQSVKRHARHAQLI